MLAGVFEAKHEQEEKDADLRAEADEVLADVQMHNSAVAKCESGKEEERDRGESQAMGDARKHGKSNRDTAQLNEQASVIVCWSGHWILSRAVRAGVPKFSLEQQIRATIQQKPKSIYTRRA